MKNIMSNSKKNSRKSVRVSGTRVQAFLTYLKSLSEIYANPLIYQDLMMHLH